MSILMLGSINHQLDEKGRMRIPARFHSSISGSVTMMPGKQKCVYIVSGDAADKIVEPLFSQSPYVTDPELDETASLISSYTELVDEDGQGRLMFPKLLAKYADIKKEIVVVGKGTYLEVWAKEVWDARFGVLNPDKLKGMLESLTKRGV